jgi:predicted nucleic acid-binding protein
MEIAYYYHKSGNSDMAKQVVDSFSKFLVDFDIDDIERSMLLRSKLKMNKKLYISYTDALGYYLAKKLKLKFLTGDSQFRGLDGVKFIG